MRFQARSLLAAALLLPLSWGLCPADEKPARTDLQGDPLPAGAVARLGTTRLRHGGQLHTLAYSPDGKWLASGGTDKITRLWDAETGKEVGSLEGHEEAVRSLAFVPAGEGKPATMLVSASEDNTIRFWDLKTGKPLSRIINHPSAATTPGFSPDGKPFSAATTLAVSPDGKLLASAGTAAPHVFLWRVEDGKEVRRWKAHQGGVMQLVFDPDGKTLASGGRARKFPPMAGEPSDDYGVALWETDTGKPWHTFADHSNILSAIAFAADGKLLASSGFDQKSKWSVLLWDAGTGKQLRNLADGMRALAAENLVLSRDGKTLVVELLGAIRFFDTDTGAEERAMADTPHDPVQALVLSPDGRTLATAGKNGHVQLWDMAQRRAKLDCQRHTAPLTSVAVAPDGKTIATTSEDGTAWLWERATGKPVRQFKPQKDSAGGAVVWCAAFSPDSRTLALAHYRDGVTFWDVATGRLRRHISQDYRTNSVAFSPDGKWLASESIDHLHASLWDTATGKLVRTYPRGTQPFVERGTSVAISPDGRLLASTARNGLNVWELESGKLAFLVGGNVGHSVTFSPGGFLVATAGYGAVLIFDTVAGVELAEFKADSPVQGWRAIAFSPDGRLLAVADKKDVKLWDVTTRRELPSFEARGILTSVAFTPDGKALVSGGEDGTALIWDLDGVRSRLKDGDAKPQWEDLHDSDRLRAYAAFCRLRASPDDALVLLKANVKPAAAVPAERLGDLLKKLDSDSFTTREQATAELKKFGLAAERALRQAAKNPPSREAGRRLDDLLAALDTGADWRQTLTALKLLEELPHASSREFLQNLARGDPDSRLTREAKAILQRVLQRGPEPSP